MKNNTNQIMKLDLPIWIKYWLSKHKNASYILSEILTGTEFFLQDSAPKKFKKFIPIGRTTQESTTGKNKFSSELELGSIDNSTGLPSSSAVDTCLRTKDYISVQPSTTYTIKNNKGYYTFLYFYQEDKTYISYSRNTTDTLTFTTDSNTYFIKLRTASDRNENDITAKYMLNTGSTAEPYEPYTGEEPAPNPNYPYAIKNTGDNGSVNEKVSNSDGTQEQNISFPLEQGQKLMKGEELKENEKDDIWSEYIFTGEENWTLYSETENVLKAYSTGPKLGRTNNMESTEDAFCTHFKNNTFYSSTNGIGLTQNATYVSVSKTIASNVSELKSWFATQYTNETPVKVQYKKKNPTTTPYTEEQQQYYDEHIKQLRTYKNITHISSEDETPANLKIQYYKEG